MSIRKIQVSFVGPDGQQHGEATGSVDRRADLIRQARAALEEFRNEARREGDPRADAEYTMSIRDAPASTDWSPRR